MRLPPPGPAGPGVGGRRRPRGRTPGPPCPGCRRWGWGRSRRGRGGRQLHARAWVRVGEGCAHLCRVGGGLTREARARARLQAAHARPLIGRLGRCGCARGARLEPWGRARPGVSGACAPRQQMRRIGRRVAGAAPCCLVTAACGRARVGLGAPPGPPRPCRLPGGTPSGLCPGRAGALASRGLFFGGNKHNDRKENLSLQAMEISRLESAAPRWRLRGGRQKNCPFSLPLPLLLTQVVSF